MATITIDSDQSDFVFEGGNRYIILAGVTVTDARIVANGQPLQIEVFGTLIGTGDPAFDAQMPDGSEIVLHEGGVISGGDVGVAASTSNSTISIDGQVISRFQSFLIFGDANTVDFTGTSDLEDSSGELAILGDSNRLNIAQDATNEGDDADDLLIDGDENFLSIESRSPGATFIEMRGSNNRFALLETAVTEGTIRIFSFGFGSSQNQKDIFGEHKGVLLVGGSGAHEASVNIRGSVERVVTFATFGGEGVFAPDLVVSGNISGDRGLDMNGGGTVTLSGTLTATFGKAIDGAVNNNGDAQTIRVESTGRVEGDVWLGGGDDAFTLAGTWSGRTINLGSGNDVFDANQSSSSVTVLGGQGLDSITGSIGDDVLNGGVQNDSVSGGGGNDRIEGGLGRDRLFGGDGADSLGGDDQDDLLDGGAGDDTLTGGSGRDRLYGGSGDDRLFGGDGRDFLVGGDGDDQLFGATAVSSDLAGDHLQGRGGNDYLEGGFGSDLLDGGGGNDEIDAGPGDDVLAGSFGRDILSGGVGNDRAYGGDSADLIFGESGDDFLVGNAGGDVIDGGTGNDNLRGRDGDDFLYGGDGADYILGDAGDDFLVGNNDNDFLSGGVGNDNLRGRDGSDRLAGGAGNDYMVGGAGDDDLNGGGDFDTLIGGDGADRFVFEGNWRRDTVGDWTDGEDTIDLSALGLIGDGESDAGAFAKLTLVQDGTTAIISVTGDTSNDIRLSNTDISTLDASDFLFETPPAASEAQSVGESFNFRGLAVLRREVLNTDMGLVEAATAGSTSQLAPGGDHTDFDWAAPADWQAFDLMPEEDWGSGLG